MNGPSPFKGNGMSRLKEAMEKLTSKPEIKAILREHEERLQDHGVHKVLRPRQKERTEVDGQELIRDKDGQWIMKKYA
jgi:dolichyl-phosphate-mannose--protein O-mannosyl transferase